MRFLLAGVLLLLSGMAQAAIHTETVEYQAGETLLEGYLAYNDSVEGPLPAVLIVHEWYGLNDHSRNSARKLAELGYAAFALDMYGKDRRTTEMEQAAAWSGEMKENPELARERFVAALETVRAHPRVDAAKVASIGYCFGGTISLEMARAGLDLVGVVSFHGGLQSVLPEGEREIQAKVLVLHGADDPLVPNAEVEAFEEEMRQAGADWYLIAYGNAVHSFTNPEADMEAARYNETAARRSWQAMEAFLEEVFE